MHDNKIIHRDLKPQNILLLKNPDTNANTVKLADFGISKLCEKTGTIENSCPGGTDFYMAPEMKLGKNYNASIDIYSFGKILEKLMTKLRKDDQKLFSKLIEGNSY